MPRSNGPKRSRSEIGPTGYPKCPKCGNSLQNQSPSDRDDMLRCATCKHVWKPSVVYDEQHVPWCKECGNVLEECGCNPVGKRMTAAPQLHTNESPLWEGPCGEGPNGGVTQSMLARFFTCRERFRLKYVLGLEPHERWNHRMGYGTMWHVCEEALAKKGRWDSFHEYVYTLFDRYPLQREEITKWANVCRVQFPEYVKYWQEHPDVKSKTPLLQEQVFDVPYTLSSGRVVRLRGRWDSVDLIEDGIYIQENKTKGDIDKSQIERQLKFDLQTMLYLIAFKEYMVQQGKADGKGRDIGAIKGVRYNVVRRPLSGGRGNISPHGAKQNKAKGTFTPAETDDEFYERLRGDYISADPGYWFFRVRAEITPDDINVFRETCLDPVLETLCDWYDRVVFHSQYIKNHYMSPMNYRTPFGIYNSLAEDGATEYDHFLETGSDATLRRVHELFEELK